MRKAIPPLGIIVLVALAVITTSNALFAQAGSTGGTIGKQDKSRSGGEETPTPRGNTPSAKSAPAASTTPSIIQLKEHNTTWGEFSATLKRTNSNTYEAIWNVGLISRMTVTIGQNSMTIERRDLSGAMNLCHGHYVGTRVPGTSKASGEDTVACSLGGAESTWDASW